MSFKDSAAEVFDRAEGSLNSLIADALKAKAYGEIAVIAEMAESLAGIGSGRAREGKKIPTAAAEFGGTPTPTPTPTADTARVSSEPSWMRPKTT